MLGIWSQEWKQWLTYLLTANPPVASFVCLPLSCFLSFNHIGFLFPGLSLRQSLCTGFFFLVCSFPIPCLSKLFILSSLTFYGTRYLDIFVLMLLLFCPCSTPITIWHHPSNCRFSPPSSLLVWEGTLIRQGALSPMLLITMYQVSGAVSVTS